MQYIFYLIRILNKEILGDDAALLYFDKIILLLFKHLAKSDCEFGEPRVILYTIFRFLERFESKSLSVYKPTVSKFYQKWPEKNSMYPKICYKILKDYFKEMLIDQIDKMFKQKLEAVDKEEISIMQLGLKYIPIVLGLLLHLKSNLFKEPCLHICQLFKEYFHDYIDEAKLN